MRIRALTTLCLTVLAVLAACDDSPPDGDGDGDADGDGDGDGDSDGDADGDADADGDGDGDSDGDADGDADADGDGDGDGDSDGDADGDCVDDCPSPGGGVTWGCERRFMYGVNYAWRSFAGDFGGIPEWGIVGVSENLDAYRADLEAMAAAGASVIRWWVFPDFRGAGVQVDGSETPTGLGGTAVTDVTAAIELAEETDLYLMLCIFSFDNFRPSRDNAGIWTPGITPMVTDGDRRAALLENVVRPLARTVQASPHRDRVIAWDVINEPEWAIHGPGLYGDDEDFDPNGELDTVTHAQMETFVSETIEVLRDESDALVTVGGAAMKWAHAWTHVDIDFYQFHIYQWVNDWWPYDNPPSFYDVDDKPVVMGEFPMGDLAPGVSYGEVVATWYDIGYAGALSWMFDGADAEALALVRAFADLHPCETRY